MRIDRTVRLALCVAAMTATPVSWGSGLSAPPEAFLGDASTPVYSPGSSMPYGAQTMDQSAFAMGTMLWNVVFVQGNGALQTQQETWTPAEISNIQTKINVAKSYWEGMTSSFQPGARLSITVNYANNANPVLTGYEPSLDRSEVWINSVMNQLGSYNSTDRYTNVRNYNQDRRGAANKNWSTTIFVLDNTSAALTSYAYAYYGGPFAILENNSAGWGPQNFNMVLSHEMGHIFFANDEYSASNAKVTDRGGYLNIANGNAEHDANGNPRTAPYPNALMLNNGNYSTGVPFAPSPWSHDQYGWRDSDSDGIPDILDTTPALTGSTAGSNPGTGTFVFSGTGQVTTIANTDPLDLYFSNSQSAMTIDTIAGAYYQLDGGAPVAFGSSDGLFDGYSEALGFILPGLPGGLHAIDIFTTSSVGNASNVLSYSFLSSAPEPATLMLLGLGAPLLLGRRKVRI